MTQRIAIFAFNGEPMCFVHGLLNALNMRQSGIDVALIIEGSATKTMCDLSNPEAEFHKLFQEVTEQGLVDCVCQACAHKMGVLEEVQRLELPLCSEMNGHPAMSRYIAEGYQIISL
jgi:hypothetical protein